MSSEALLGLINNAALLLALAVVYDTIPQLPNSNTGLMKSLTGGILGLIGVVVMITHWHFTAEVVFDTHSILLSLTGLFFGLIPTLVATAITGLFRIYIDITEHKKAVISQCH